jgi:hypothetical protein
METVPIRSITIVCKYDWKFIHLPFVVAVGRVVCPLLIYPGLYKRSPLAIWWNNISFVTNID